MTSNYEAIRADNIRRRGEDFDDIGRFISEQLYSDRTHFVYELLQNAEDAEATRISFLLKPNCLEVRHDGRPFDEEDVRAVCDILRGTKKGDAGKIGKFGIGFKSVYAFTALPEIHSGDEHFRIERYIRPSGTSERSTKRSETLFVFPFDHPELTTGQAYDLIATRLRELGLRTLLFLRHIGEVTWSIEGGTSGHYAREVLAVSQPRRISVVGTAGSHLSREDWLVFERRVDSTTGNGDTASEELLVQIAFRLAKDRETGRESVVPEADCPLVVFFPTQKQTGLSFLIQGPYRTTPARDNVSMSDPWNKNLVLETAAVTADALPILREMGLLTVPALEALPIEKPDGATYSWGMFRPIYERVRSQLIDQPLLPGQGGRGVAGRLAKLARGAELRALLTDTQLRQLWGASSPIHWLSDEITLDRAPELRRYLREDLEIEEVTPESFAAKLTGDFLREQTDAWMLDFYSFLEGQRALWRAPSTKWDRGGPLRHKPIIRLEDNRHVSPFDKFGAPNAYLPPRGVTEFPIVKRTLAASERAASLLRNLGLAEPDTVDEVLERVLARYVAGETVGVTPDEYVEDVGLIFDALGRASGDKRARLLEALGQTPWVNSVSAGTGDVFYTVPSDTYDRTHELERYFAGNDDAFFVLREPFTADQLKALRDLGVSDRVRVARKPADVNGYVSVSSSFADHERGVNGFDPTCQIDGLEHVLGAPTSENSAFIWNTLLSPNRAQVKGQVQRASHKHFDNARSSSEYSVMGRLVTEALWLPGPDGRFHRPQDLTLDELPASFRRDPELAVQLGMKANAVAQLAEQVGISPEDLDFIRQNPQAFADWRAEQLSAMESDDEEIETEPRGVAFGALLRKKFDRPQLREPEERVVASEHVRNPDRYAVGLEMELAHNVEAEPDRATRFHKVPRNLWEAKNNQVRPFLREQYAGACQICGESFVKRNGEPYFEGLYLVSHTEARWLERQGNVLSVCPTCCAKLQFGSVVADDITGQVLGYVPRNLGGRDEPAIAIVLCGDEVEIHFKESHLLDLQALVKLDPVAFQGLTSN